ncbi:unnamed protein product [Bursaphelenchus xylophilus]|uniref:(pine wood nematode) hypothetical protein n=1 Tax=Bursaphelenchus xylophilus TaxID=6326 RepID=A0A1I7S3H2_BURXY|nr:unnamed protein product [Bursaphelenchus xylophilus]CAG9116308.1 unnamed protein product [Bursaphelenchus xylophilus]
MSYEAKVLFDATQNAGSLLHFDFLVDESFVLVVGLTSKGNIVIFHESRNQKSCNYVNIYDIYSDFVETILINLLPDASAIVLVLSNSNLLVIPTKYVINANWAHRQSYYTQPVVLNLEFSGPNKCLHLPTSVVSYLSKINNRYYLIFSQKSGAVNVVDLELQKVIASIRTDETIDELQVFRHESDGILYLIVSQFTGKQYLWPLETKTEGIREVWSHFVPDSDLISVSTKLNSHNYNKLLTLYNSEMGTLTTIKELAGLNNQTGMSVPQKVWITYYSPHLMVFVVSEQEIQYTLPFDEEMTVECIELNCGLPCRPLGFVPLLVSSDGLGQCLFINSTGFYSLEPVSCLPEFTLEFLTARGFSKNHFVKFCEATKNEQAKLYEKVLVESIKQKKEGAVDGIIYLGIDLAIPLQKIAAILTDNQEFDALIPFLSIKCQKDRNDVESREILFDAYLNKLYKNGPSTSLETDIYLFLIEYQVSEDSLKVFLKNKLLSCVLIFLLKSRSTVSQEICSYFLDNPDWKDYNRHCFLQIIVNLQWNSVDGTTKQALLKLLAKFCVQISDLHELVMVLNMAETGLKTDPVFLNLFILIGLYVQYRLHGLSITSWSPFSCGSNFCAVLADDRSLWVWGEFVAGNIKTKSLSSTTMARSSTRSIIDKPLFRMTKAPRRIQLHKDIVDDSVGVCEIKCGTEHILMLDAGGRVYSYGKNRFGQCGVGHMDPVAEITRIEGNFGRIKGISAGHYHSALLDENFNVWMFGWAIHGQLGINTVANVTVPVIVRSLSNLNIRKMELGMAHSLFLTESGQVYGFGHMDNGELIKDPAKDPTGLQKQKSFKPMKLDLPEPMELISCNYFQGLGVSKSAIYQWGECPQTLKMNAFWQKHKTAKSKAQAGNTRVKSPIDQWPSEGGNGQGRDHFQYKKMVDWDMEERPIKQISCGYNHSALLTQDGEIYTWGKGLDKQLGHGTKTDKIIPTKLVEPVDVVWKYVHCGRNTTMAITNRGECFIWGRNDRGQLGVKGSDQSSSSGDKNDSTPKRYVLKSSTGNKRRPIEVPVSQCIDKPTVILSLNVAVHHMAVTDLDIKLRLWIDECSQSNLDHISRDLRSLVIYSPQAVKVQFKAGDLISGLQRLVLLYEIMKKTTNNFLLESTDSQNGNTPSSSSTSTKPMNQDDFEGLMEISFQLLSAHPAEEIKLVAGLLMMKAQFPIYNRISINQRLCRLLAGHIELPQNAGRSGRMSASPLNSLSSTTGSTILSSSDYCTSGSLNRQKMSELNQKERAVMLKKARLPGNSKMQLLIKRATELSDKFVFYSGCGHFERKVVPTSVQRRQQQRVSDGSCRCSLCVPP